MPGFFMEMHGFPHPNKLAAGHQGVRQMQQDIQAQIEALLDGEPLRWALPKLGISVEELLQEPEEEKARALRRCWTSFTVTREEIDELVRARGYGPEKWCRCVISDEDGWYFIPQDG